jgi:hypothetical protein
MFVLPKTDQNYNFSFRFVQISNLAPHPEGETFQKLIKLFEDTVPEML